VSTEIAPRAVLPVKQYTNVVLRVSSVNWNLQAADVTDKIGVVADV
jgi:hypothetical protein